LSQYKTNGLTNISKTYDMIFCDTKNHRCYFKKISKCIILLSVSDRFKPIVPFCVCVYPLKWHETEYFSVKPVKNWDYVLGKQYETEYFSVKLVENRDYVLGNRYETDMKPSISLWNWWKSRLCLKLIISELCQFVNLKWLKFKKSQFMTVFIRIFIKKDLNIEFKLVLFQESPVANYIKIFLRVKFTGKFYQWNLPVKKITGKFWEKNRIL
jgi:hypothetical protein